MFELFLKGLIIGFAIAAPVGPISPLHACGTTFLLTLTNPATILSFVAVFAGLGLSTVNPDFMSAIFLVLGITLGSAAWWLSLSSFVAFILHKRVNPTFMRIIVGIRRHYFIIRISGIIGADRINQKWK